MSKITVVAVAAGVVVLVAGVGLYNVNNNIAQQEKQFNEELEKISKSLPKEFKQTNNLTKGLFSSDGIYKLSYQEKEKIYTLVTDYKVSHGPLTWFGADMKVKTNTKLEGDFAQYIQGKPSVLALSGSIESDGSFNFKGIGDKIVLNIPSKKGNASISIEEAKSHMTYVKSTEEVKSQISYPSITIEHKKDKLEIKNIKMTRNFSMNAPELGDFGFKIDEVVNDLFTIKNIDVYANGLIKNDKLDIMSSLKASSINVPALGQKDIGLELAYSLKGLSKTVLQLHKELSENTNDEFTPEQKTKLVNNAKEILKTGAIFSLDKLNVKSAQGALDFSGAIQLKPVATAEEISFSKNIKLSINLLITGDYAKMASAFAAKREDNFLVIEPNQVKSSALFEDGTLSINGEKLPQEYTEDISDKLLELDEQLKLLK